MKVVLNGYLFEAHEINVGIPQGSLFCTTLVLLYISDLVKKFPRLLLNFYADDNTFYGFTSKSPNDQRQATDLSSDLASV